MLLISLTSAPNQMGPAGVGRRKRRGEGERGKRSAEISFIHFKEKLYKVRMSACCPTLET